MFQVLFSMKGDLWYHSCLALCINSFCFQHNSNTDEHCLHSFLSIPISIFQTQPSFTLAVPYCASVPQILNACPPNLFWGQIQMSFVHVNSIIYKHKWQNLLPMHANVGYLDQPMCHCVLRGKGSLYRKRSQLRLWNRGPKITHKKKVHSCL